MTRLKTQDNLVLAFERGQLIHREMKRLCEKHAASR